MDEQTSPGQAVDPVAGERGAGAGAAGGSGGVVRRHPRVWLTVALAAAFALLATGSFFGGGALASASGEPSPEPVPVETIEPEPEPEPEARPVPDQIPQPARLRSCSVQGVIDGLELPSLYAAVYNGLTGEVLLDRSADVAERTASGMKVLTASAAIAVLGPDYRIQTDVVQGSAPGTVVLVGRGDATLSRLPAGQESVYPGAPKLADLAQQAIAAFAAEQPEGVITDVVLDSSFWPVSDGWIPDWTRDLLSSGYHTEITALQIDGDRNEPWVQNSPRSGEPITRAGESFLAALQAADTSGVLAPSVTVTTGTASEGAPVLASVQSQPVRSLLPQMLRESDNVVAEMLGRIMSKELGLGGTSGSLTTAILTGLREFGGVPDTIEIWDASGLSSRNSVPALYLAAFYDRIRNGNGGLDVVREALPVAGVHGTLAPRFSGANAELRGNLVGKSGWIGTAYTLSGYFAASDDVPLLFAIYSVDESGIRDVRGSHDTLVTAIHACGDNLSNN